MIETLVAIIPAIILLLLIYTADSREKEPWDLVFKAFFLGVLSVIVIAFVETFLDDIFCLLLGEGTLPYIIIGTLIGVALVEEFFKLCAAMAITWKSPRFNYVFDGVVYCAAAALGYAAIENVFYVISAGSDFLSMAAIRGVISVPSHMADGVFMGIFIGFAKLWSYRGDKGKARLFQVLALAVPICEHCLFDVLCTVDWAGAEMAFNALVVIEYIIALVIILKFRGKGDIPIPIPEEVAVAQQPASAPAQVVVPPHATLTAQGVELCPVCRRAVLDGARFCVHCGYDLQSKDRFCPNCAAELKKDASFCSNCGAAVADKAR